ncbi:hypothetical protein [Streptomyces sp.]|uniref:hypothetical protein n=1 Tax=Streptomyces sp. TaxID=1931 RepID=UPI00281195B5|nr:hypothetical protein [Streptomyces sp.]
MTARIIGGLLYDLDDGPVGTDFGRGFDGRPEQRLVLGDEQGSDKLSISLTTTSLAGIDDLIEALHRIRDIKTQQRRLSEVAA